jgi:uncharacterized SAM-binding protein YcdF (DUF218 family)
MKRALWPVRAALATGILVLGLVAWAALARAYAPASNAHIERFDTIIVLGYRADSDGNPTPEALARITEAVREYERGVAPRLIITGGPVRNQFVEADMMARAAAAQGIPPSAIFLEPHARDTIQNACYSERVMKAHGWRSAEVISSAHHLPRAGLIFDRLPIQWRTHAAPSLEPTSALDSAVSATRETISTIRYLTYANWAERCEP